MAKVALLIGVSEYEPGLNALPAAVKDIEALRRVLQDPEMGGFDQVKTLANPDRQTMESEIETLFDGRAKGDLVLLFFSGHGIKDDASTLYFASRNTKKNAKGDLIRSTAVETRFVHNIMNNSRAKRQAIILDCCFSGAFDPAFQSKDDGSVDLQTQLGAEGRVVLTSSSSTQYSFEQQGSELSIYTRYLVEGIETGAGDTNSDGFVSMLELHEYAASKVQETAPKMTPKIIVLKDKGFEIVLAKARVTDPKLKYRKTATRYANAGMIRPAGRAVLNTLRQQLGLTLEETTEIEAEVLRPYQERLANLQQYRETLIAEAEHEYPLGEFAREDLNTLQQMLGLRDEDILPIQQEVEAQFTQQSAAYQQNLVQYEQTLTDAIQQDFPFNQQTHQDLQGLQQSLRLRDEDITRIGQPLIQQAEHRHQEKLRQKAEKQRQDQENAEYENKLRRYEQEFNKAVQVEYPLNQHVLSGLKSFQQQLELKDEDVARIEKPIHEKAECHKQNELGNFFKKQGRLDEAVTEFQKAIQIDPSYVDSYNNLGDALDEQGKLDEAIIEFQKAIRIDPRNVAAYANLGCSLAKQGKLDEAIAACQKAIQVDSNSALAYCSLGFVLHKQGKLDDAILQCLKAIEVDSEYALSYNNLGSFLSEQGKVEDAIAALHKAIQVDPSNAVAHAKLGSVLRGHGKLEEAIAAYRKAIQIDPNLAAAHSNLGAALYSQGKFDEAIAAYRKAIQIDPNLAAAHNNLGSALNSQGKFDEALAAYRQAIQLEPNTATFQNNLDIMLKEQGKGRKFLGLF